MLAVAMHVCLATMPVLASVLRKELQHVALALPMRAGKRHFVQPIRLHARMPVLRRQRWRVLLVLVVQHDHGALPADTLLLLLLLVLLLVVTMLRLLLLLLLVVTMLRLMLRRSRMSLVRRCGLAEVRLRQLRERGQQGRAALAGRHVAAHGQVIVRVARHALQTHRDAVHSHALHDTVGDPIPNRPRARARQQRSRYRPHSSSSNSSEQ